MEDFILTIPKWEGEIIFSKELITLILVIVALIAGVLLCFWGYRYFKTIALIILGCFSGALGYRIGQGMTSNLILQMCMVIMITFLGVCLFYFLAILWSWFTNKIGIQTFLQRFLHIIAALIGALFVGVITYTQVYQNGIAVIIITVLLAGAGIWYGMRSIKARRVFRTYEDLLRLKPLTEEKENA